MEDEDEDKNLNGGLPLLWSLANLRKRANCIERQPVKLRRTVSTTGAMRGNVSPEHADQQRITYLCRFSPVLGARVHTSTRSRVSASACQHGQRQNG